MSSWAAQSVGHLPCKEKIPGSIPSQAAFFSHPVTQDFFCPLSNSTVNPCKEKSRKKVALQLIAKKWENEARLL